MFVKEERGGIDAFKMLQGQLKSQMGLWTGQKDVTLILKCVFKWSNWCLLLDFLESSIFIFTIILHLCQAFHNFLLKSAFLHETKQDLFLWEQVFLMWQSDAEKSLLTFAFYSITGINNIFIFKVNIQNWHSINHFW